MRWVNALDQVSVTSCTWSPSHVSWDATCTPEVVEILAEEGLIQDQCHRRDVLGPQEEEDKAAVGVVDKAVIMKEEAVMVKEEEGVVPEMDVTEIEIEIDVVAIKCTFHFD